MFLSVAPLCTLGVNAPPFAWLVWVMEKAIFSDWQKEV